MAVEGRALTAREARVRRIALPAVVRRHWAVLLVLAAFAAAALIVPTLTPVAISDDWTYARSAQILLAEGRLTIFPIVVATAIFPIVWGAFFGLLLGPTLGVFRLSTVVLTALGGLALYALCRDLGVSRSRSALGVAAFLFNPLVFVLAFTFMTDAHFVALLVMATWLFARSLTPSSSFFPPSPPPLSTPYLIAGSAASALAMLTRHQGALIIAAVITYLLCSRRLRCNWASARLLASVTAIPLLAVAGYVVWLHGNGTAAMQGAFLGEVIARGRDGTWWLLRWLTVFVLIYIGFFVLPLAAAALPGGMAVVRRMPARGWIFVVTWSAIVGVGAWFLLQRGALMPYLPQFFGSTGLGPPDVLGERPVILDTDARLALTAACLLASLLFSLAIGRALAMPAGLERSRSALVGAVAIWQFLGIFPPSYHFLGWSAGSVDRYLEPLAPLAIALLLWALRDRPIALPAGWAVVAVLALFAIAGTRDYLVYMGAVWSTAEHALAAGVPLARLDAGASWDGDHLYEYGVANHIDRLHKRTPQGGPWWTDLFAPATDSAYVVSGAPLAGHDVIFQRAYSSWLDRQATTLYLLKRQGETWPP